MVKYEYMKDALNLTWELRKTIKAFSNLDHLLMNIESAEGTRPLLENFVERMKENPVTDDFLKISQTYELIARKEKELGKRSINYIFLDFMEEIGVETEIFGEENIPKSGGSLYVSNHPYGYLDGIALIGRLGSFIKEMGQKFKVVASQNLKIIKGIEEVISFVSSGNCKKSDFSCLRNSLKYLDNGGNLAVYPSGSSGGAELKEYPWKTGIIPLVAHSSQVVPMWLSGPDNGTMYNFLARHKMTENLREILGIRALWGKEGNKIVLNVGKPLRSKDIMSIENKEDRIKYLRGCAENLAIF